MPNAILPPWWRTYSRQAPLADAIAGLVLAVLLVPQSMAFALLAGLPPEAGLYTALIPPVLYALIGQASSVSVGPVALGSLLVGEAIGGVGLPAAEAAAVVAIEVGVLLTLLGACRLGRIVNFISEPALLGLMAAAAVLIAVSQLPALFGVEAGNASALPGAAGALVAAGAPDPVTLAVGTSCLVALWSGGRFAGPLCTRLGLSGGVHLAVSRSVPLVIMCAAAVITSIASLDIERVQEPVAGLPSVGFSIPGPAAWIDLFVPSVIIAVLVFVGGTAVAKSMPGATERRVDTSREALALGTANLAAGLTGGYAAGVSLSRSALVHDAGARSPLATLIGASTILPVLFFLGPALATLPRAALAALVISAVTGLVKVAAIRDVIRQSRAEALVVAITLLATLLLGVRAGLLLGTVAGLAAFLWVSSLPRVTVVGRTERPGIYRSVEDHEVEIDTLPVLVLRIDRELYFGNVDHAENRIGREIAAQEDVRGILFDMRAVNDVDVTAGRMLRNLIERFRASGLVVGFCVVQAPVLHELRLALPRDSALVSLTVEEGVERLRRAIDARHDVSTDDDADADRPDVAH